MATNQGKSIKENPALRWGIFLVVLVVIFLLGMLAASITEKRAQINTLYTSSKKVELTGIESNNDKWKENYPREYSTWLKTADMDFKSKHMGNKVEDVLEHRPNMVVLWAGYAFAKDYNAPRGHMYAIKDIRESLRTATPQNDTDGPMFGTCWTCKGPDVPRMMDKIGIDKFYQSKWGALGSEIVNPIGCADCHDPQTSSLKITRPALKNAFEAQGKDIDKASLQEMRSLVCAQCHVEYYFTTDKKELTFPWKKGMKIEDMENYYDELQFSDWTHALSKAPLLKAQHPDYELSLFGPHGQRGVSCADCHMPYKSEGGVKFSDHHVMSPLNNISGTCGTCHRESEENLRHYVEENQDRILELRDRLEPELVKAHIMAKAAWDNGATEAEMAPVLKLIRQAQWRWDISVASHGASFHAPVETQRIMAAGLDKTMQAQLALQKILMAHNINEVAMPDLSTKEKAQAYVGLNMPKLRAEKEEWKKTVVPQWLDKAEKSGILSESAPK